MTYQLPPQQPRTGDGRYSTVPRGESTATLTVPDREYNAEGTFAFPPIARSYEQLVDFWMTVPVPDQVLHQLRAEYSNAQYDWRAARILAEHPEPEKFRYGAITDAWNAWFRRINDFEVDLKAEHPAEISPELARPIARATMLVRQARKLEPQVPGVTDAVMDTPLNLSILGCPTVGSMLELYPTLDLPETTWGDQATEFAAVAADKLEELVELLGATEAPQSQ
ncbi:hypothetical protein CHO01_31570 [Cellulomonas hominis]|uniref:Uncharacterized protein n=1 Tax=Cellulomonas hominis TaxID=156981 RepID=A0A511FFP2_9CELL|nr:hypothetical protein [Cellulomonas hominis]MBB5474783.1 hypothetical protein [Cellulomonas hominis]NKY05812.1 hypothetical protein [Cellulomonas hominis]GEL48041.1 hypothetical protein CHO01_31570 [Cellulomonas hominis]